MRCRRGPRGRKYLSSALSLFRGCRLHDPELFNFRHRYRRILFNSLDSINYTGVRLQASFPSLILALPPSSPSLLRVVLLNNPVLIPRPRPRMVSRDTRVYQGKPLSVSMPREVKVAGHVTWRVADSSSFGEFWRMISIEFCTDPKTAPTCNREKEKIC